MKKCPKCNAKYRDTDFYCLKDNYRLIQCIESELTEQEKMQDKRDNDRFKNPNKYGNFSSTPNTNTPHCPTCQSTNIKKISTTNKVGSAVAFGVFSVGHISKTFKCNNCGMKF